MVLQVSAGLFNKIDASKELSVPQEFFDTKGVATLSGIRMRLQVHVKFTDELNRLRRIW